MGDRWTLEELLTQGSLTDTYRSHDPASGACQVQVIPPELTPERHLWAEFLREAQAANQVGHPGIVKVLGHGVDARHGSFWVEDLGEGSTLFDLARSPEPPSLRQLWELTHQLLDTLAAAHAVGLLHRDIRPENLFVSRDGELRLRGFGIARLREAAPAHLKRRSQLAQSALTFMPPEQALGQSAEMDARADLFSVGATLFLLISGRPIHSAPSEGELLIAVASTEVSPLREAAPNVSAATCAVVDRCLAFEIQHRYPDARTLQRDVSALLKGLAPPFASQLGPVSAGKISAARHGQGKAQFADEAASEGHLGTAQPAPPSSASFHSSASLPTEPIRDLARTVEQGLDEPPRIPAPSRTGFTHYPIPGRNESLWKGGARNSFRRLQTRVGLRVRSSDPLPWLLLALGGAFVLILGAIIALLIYRSRTIS